MRLNEVEKLVRKGESEVLEFKTSTANVKSAFETICAFLNAKGGTVLIGINNNGRIIGQTVTDQTNLEISNLVSTFSVCTKIVDLHRKIETPVSGISSMLPTGKFSINLNK